MSEEIKDTVFVGGIPYDMTEDEFNEEVTTWGHVTKMYFRFHGGWGTVTFDSNSYRSRFLKDKSKHRLGRKLVEIKPYVFNPDKAKASGNGPNHLVIGKGQVKVTSESNLKKAEEAKNTSIIEKQMSDIQASNQVEAQTGIISKYVGSMDGLIKTAKFGEIAFGIESVYLCRAHKFSCHNSLCGHYIAFKKWNSSDLPSQLPIGTNVSFFYRSVVFREITDTKYQATLVWPQSCKRPSAQVTPLTADEMNQALVRFSVSISFSGLASSNSSASPTPSLSSNGSVSRMMMLSSNQRLPPPAAGFGKQLNYDVPLVDLLDDEGEDLDKEAGVLMQIKDFLDNELGSKLNGNVPITLMNNVRSSQSDEMILQEIVNFAKSKQISIDSNKRESIALGLRKLRQSFSSSIAAEDNLSFLSNKAFLQNDGGGHFFQALTDKDLDFVYKIPLNQEYLSLLETLYGHFLKAENLDFRLDFDQAFKKLSPFFAFKTFEWILDWTSNDSRKKLRQQSDLRDFENSEEILGALEQFWNNLKRIKAKSLMEAFARQSPAKLANMLATYAKLQIFSLAILQKTCRALKELCPDHELAKKSVPTALALIEYKAEGKSSKFIDHSAAKACHEDLYAWLDANPVMANVECVHDGIKHDHDFQKVALLNAWQGMSSFVRSIESTESVHDLIRTWIGCIDTNDFDIDPGTVAKKTLDFVGHKLALPQTALDFAWSLSPDHQGFVAHHYNDNFGLVITVQGKHVLFDKSVAFVFKGHWKPATKVTDLAVGTYVKIREDAKVATKVWPCSDSKAAEPMRVASKYVRGRKFLACMDKNVETLTSIFPALRTDSKANFKDTYFSQKTFAYAANASKRKSYELYLESKDSLNGDVSEAVDVMASLGIGLGQLVALFMASRLLGFQGHEKIIDILATARPGVPDPLEFATEMVAFLEENFRNELSNVMAQTRKDIKARLGRVEDYLLQSGLYEQTMSNVVVMAHNFSMPPPPVVSSNGMTSQLASIEANHEELKGLVDKHKLENNACLKVILEKLTALSADMDTLKNEVKAVKGLELAPGGAPFKNGTTATKSMTTVYVKVSNGGRDLHEFPIDDDGNLSIPSVSAIYQGITALKFECDGGNGLKTVRFCRKIGDIFEPPDGVWGDRTYHAHCSLPALPSTSLPSSIASAALAAAAANSFSGYPFMYPHGLSHSLNTASPLFPSTNS